MLSQTKFENPVKHFSFNRPTEPVLYFSQSQLNERLSVFQNGLEGTVCYAVKCNPHESIIKAMVKAGIDEFDVASPQEISLLRSISPRARLNYNNPIRSTEEIQFALDNGVRSFSVDCEEELEKLSKLAPKDCEISVRLKLELEGAAYHFGDKFGETPENFVKLLKSVNELGYKTSATFHVGTQCEKPNNYRTYIEEVARCTKEAGVQIHRLNVGGGFPSARDGVTPKFTEFFKSIHLGLKSFEKTPKLLAEPGRALIADACEYIVRIKSIRSGRWAFLNDGVYGGLSDLKLMGSTPYAIYAPDGQKRDKNKVEYSVYGPTCDSIDSFEEKFLFPEDTEEGDYLLFKGAGAYLLGLNTSFNGYGQINFEEVDALSL